MLLAIYFDHEIYLTTFTGKFFMVISDLGEWKDIKR